MQKILSEPKKWAGAVALLGNIRLLDAAIDQPVSRISESRVIINDFKQRDKRLTVER